MCVFLKCFSVALVFFACVGGFWLFFALAFFWESLNLIFTGMAKWVNSGIGVKTFGHPTEPVFKAFWAGCTPKGGDSPQLWWLGVGRRSRSHRSRVSPAYSSCSTFSVPRRRRSGKEEAEEDSSSFLVDLRFRPRYVSHRQKHLF